MSEKELEKYLLELTLGNESKREFVIGQGCKTKGYVTRTPEALNLCNDPSCVSCKEWDEAFKQAADRIIKNLDNGKE